MSMAMLADFLMVKKSLGQQAFVGIICGLIIALSCGNVNVIPAIIMFMVVIGQFISLVALDERNAWESYRCALPVSRGALIVGRMGFMVLLALAFLALGTAAAVVTGLVAPPLTGVFFLRAGDIVLSAEDLAITAAGSLSACLALMGVFCPVIAKFGMTKATRILPLVLVMVFLGIFVFTGGGEGALFDVLGSFLGSIPLGAAGALLVVIGGVVYVAGGVLAVRFYEAREF